MRDIVRAKAISHVFREGAVENAVLHSVDLCLHSGELLFVMGPSGSGKTTLLHILGCLLRPTAGELEVCNENARSLDDEALCKLRLKHFGFLFQANALCSSLTATENVMVSLSLSGKSAKESREKARNLLSAVGLASRCDALPGMLSGGEKQRVSIARALAGDPALLLADEPTSALDSENGATTVRLLQKLAHEQNRGVVVVTHDPRILSFADRVLFVQDGRVFDQQPV